MNVQEALAKMIKAYGAEYVFTLTGGPQEPLIKMRNNEGINVVLARSERAAFAMADGYARITGKPTFGYVQFGVGTTFLPTALIDAYWGKSPLVAISGSMNTATQYLYEYQEVDDDGMFDNLTKWAGRLPEPDRITDLVRTAVRAAVTGVPGPAYLSIPANFYTKPLSAEPNIYAEEEFTRVPGKRIPPIADDIEKAVRLLAAAAKPVILAGGGVLLSGAWDVLTEFAESLNIPVMTSMAGKGAIAEGHPLSVGVCGRYSRKVANDVLEGCDLCLAVGSQLGAMTTTQFKFPTAKARIVHMDINPRSLGRTYREDVSILSDATLGLRALSDACGQAKLQAKTVGWNDWTKEVQARVDQWRDIYREKALEKIVEGRLNPVHVMEQLNSFVAADHTVVADTGYMAAWSGALVEQKEAGRNTLRAAGSLGWAFPAGFGAKLAVGNSRRVITLTGDGGMGYHLADFETAVRLNIPVTVVIMNNASLAFEYHIQKLLYKEMCPDVSEFLDVRFDRIGRDFGGFGERVAEPDTLVAALRRAEESGKPAIIDIAISREVYPPMVRYETAVPRNL